MRNPELHDWSDQQLIDELRSRGVLKTERRTEDVFGKWLHKLARYSTGWRIEDEVLVEGVGDE